MTHCVTNGVIKREAVGDINAAELAALKLITSVHWYAENFCLVERIDVMINVIVVTVDPVLMFRLMSYHVTVEHR